MTWVRFPSPAPFFLLVVLLLSGCAGGPYRIDLMPAPDVYDEGLVDPFAGKQIRRSDVEHGILYATDRMPADDFSQPPFYLNKRGYLLRLGEAGVRLGEGEYTWEEARRISLLKNRAASYPLQVSEVEEYGVLADSISVFDRAAVDAGEAAEASRRYAREIDRRMKLTGRKDIFIYVHGFKVNFENPILVAAELWHFLGYEGAFIAYAWPSTPSVWAYASDTETAALAARNLRRFVQYLARETDVERIHIVGYSAGTRVVTGSLADLALLHARDDDAAIRRQTRLGHVVLVGSDVDRDLFGDYLIDGLLRVPQHLSIYASAHDKALGMSRWFYNRRRLGQIVGGQQMQPAVADWVRAQPKLTLIDVTDAEGSATGNGHGYFRSSPWVSSDVLMTLMYDLGPAERGLVLKADQPIWTFPADYIERLRKALAAANPDLGVSAETLKP